MRIRISSLIGPGAACLVSLLAAGCPHRLPDVPPAERLESAPAVMEAVGAAGRRLRSLRATGTVDMRRGTKRIKATMLAVLERPARLRFETESFFEQPLSILVTDGMEFSMWDLDQGRFVVGRATPANVARVIPIPMDGPEVAGILFGDPPWIPYATAELAWDDGCYRLTLRNARQRQVVRIHPVRFRPLEVTCHLGDRLWYRLEYEEWHQRPEDVFVPAKVFFEMPAEEIRLIMKLKHAEANPALDEGLFKLHPPQDLPVERLEP